jgi:hypothetical protein
MKYTVLTTPTDSRSAIIRQIVEKKSLGDQVRFLDIRSDEAAVLVDNLGVVFPGTIVDDSGQEISVSKLLLV